jgi:putative transcriptional regulator
MGDKRLKIVDVARDTDINRGTITRMYHDQASRVELETLETLCRYLEVDIADLYELIDE